ncbi:MAG: nickel-dependent hydrogenase large subunit [Acetobacteraceae bacterium]|nr:nickel-dependent hydrogenase large subunit [Acetobacteraceae bacterium]
MVHAALRDAASGEFLLASGEAPEGRYAALSPARPGAILFERMIRDLWGLSAEGGVDQRPWLDHGRWPFSAPLSGHAARHAGPPPQPEFLPVAGEGVHQIAVGPIHAGIIEPGHFRFHVQGETLVRLEARLGYTHKGILGLILGKSPRAAARFPARLSGDSTVAHALAFCRAAEAALGVEAPARAAALREAMLELERVHNHLHDIGFVCNDASFPWPLALCGALREGLLRANALAFGHRLMMDRVLPGGVAPDIAPDGIAPLLAALDAIAGEWPRLLRVIESHASLQDRLEGTGVIAPELAARYAAGGYVGRASGRGFDARGEAVAGFTAGDVKARLAVRLAEVPDSIARIRRLLSALPEGETTVPLPTGRGGEGAALAEGFRGECLAWLRLDDGGLIEAAFLRDPSWLHWPLLERAAIGNIVADFPLINKSINGSYSGCDL